MPKRKGKYLWELVAELTAQGKSAHQCSKELEVPLTVVHRAAAHARARGLNVVFSTRLESRLDAVVALSQEGCSPKDIAAKLGVDLSGIYKIIRIAKSKGYDLSYNQISADAFLNRLLERGGYRIKTGGVGKALVGLPTEVAEWVCNQVPKDATLADVVRAIIIDSYNDDITS